MISGPNREEFNAIYREHHVRVFRFAIHMTADRAKATEVTQDVFVWLIHHPNAFDPVRGEMGAFLIGVARKFVQKLRRAELRLIPFVERTQTGFGRPERADTSESEAEQLRSAVARLPDRYREAVVLCDLEGMSYEAAAAALECAVGTVRSRLHRARALLARKLRLQSTGVKQGCEA